MTTSTPLGSTGLRRIAPALVAVVVLVAVWQVYVDVSGIRPQVLPSPSRVVAQGWSHRAEIGVHAAATLQVTLIGFTVSLRFQIGGLDALNTMELRGGRKARLL